MVDSVKVKITADGSQVTSETKKVRRDLEGVSSAGDSLSRAFSKFGGVVAGALSIGAVTSFLRNVNQAADQLNDLSGRLGASAAGLQALQLAAQQAGGSAEGMSTALSKMSVTIGNSLAGQKKATEALDRLGLSAKELAGLKTDQAFLKIDEALGNVTNSFDRASAGAAIFGKGYMQALAGLSGEAAAEVARVNEELERQGAAITDLDIAKIGVMNDDLALQSQIVTNLGTKFLANLSPAVNVAVDAVGNMLTNMGGATEAGKTFGVVMVGAIKLVEAAVYSLAAVFETLRSIVAVVLAAITNAVGNIIGLVASAAEIANLGIADELRAASDAALDLGRSFAGISASAAENARKAGSAALQSAKDFLRAQEIFDQAATAAEARAAAAAGRNRAAQGATLGESAGGGESAAKDKKNKDEGKFTVSDASLYLQKDPKLDPRILLEETVLAGTQEIRDAYYATAEGKLDQFNKTMFGSMLYYNDLTLAAEEAKNMSLGQMGNNLASMAMQAGGKLGKIGKAYAIAQTVWSTGTAVMKAMAEVPYPANIAAAAMIAAKGVLQLANIKKTNMTGSGSIAGAGGGGTPAATAPSLSDNVSGTAPGKQEEQTVTQVVIQGNVFSSQETADWIIGQIREAVEARDVVFISSNSRQAMELGA